MFEVRRYENYDSAYDMNNDYKIDFDDYIQATNNKVGEDIIAGINNILTIWQKTD